jgi:signal transduction histidine kinase
MTARTRALAIWGLAGATVVSIAGTAVLDILSLSRWKETGADSIGTVMVIVATLAFTAVGVIIAGPGRNPIGWIFLVMGLGFSFGLGFTSSYAEYGLIVKPGSLPGAHWAAWLDWVSALALLGFVPVFLLFPDGRLPSRRWRPVVWLFIGGASLSFVWSAFRPRVIGLGPTGTEVRFANPAGIEALRGVAGAMLVVGAGSALLSAVLAIVSLVLRRRRADAVARAQIRWLSFVGLTVLVLFVGFPFVSAIFGDQSALSNVWFAVFAFVLVLGTPAAVTIAIMKYRLYDIDVVINKTLVYGLLAAFITAVYVGFVVGIGQAIGSKRNLGLSILATAVVAVGFQPVRDRVQHVANRLVYGKRATPYEVLSEFSGRMSGAYATEDLLPRMARILAEGTGASRADVWLHVGHDLYPEASWPAEGVPHEPVAVSDGEVPEIEHIDRLLPVRHRGELLGALSVTKSRGDPLRPAEEKLMEDLASGAGLVLRNVRLTAELLARLEELKASRQRIVAAQDEERRKLERNLHDGAQQQLVALQVRLSLAERLAEEGCRVKDQLASLKAEAGDALENLRDLARGIYPPLLADQGLAAALKAQARKAAMPVEVIAERLVRYPQDQEAAVYFCVLEALQNVAKYAGANQVTVRLSEDEGHLAFSVADDGAGFDTTRTSYGTGLQGMADRLAAQGGDLEVRSAPGSGTTVIGWVPVPVMEMVGA